MGHERKKEILTRTLGKERGIEEGKWSGRKRKKTVILKRQKREKKAQFLEENKATCIALKCMVSLGFVFILKKEKK